MKRVRTKSFLFSALFFWHNFGEVLVNPVSVKTMSEATPCAYDKNNPYPAKLKVRCRANAPESQKETVHLEIDLGDSGLVYKSGDSLGVFPKNAAPLVDAVLKAYKFSGDETITLPKTETTMSLRDALTSQFSLGAITKKFVQFVSDNAACDCDKAKLAEVLGSTDPVAQKAWIDARHVLDLGEEFSSVKCEAQAFVEQLRKLAPRLYSISSSPEFVGKDCVHLTVAVVRYETNGHKRDGVCSTFLGEYAEIANTPLPVFVAKSHFGPPEDLNAPMIMVGPGTGIAPFRSFVQDRAAKGAKGKNWLFFGDQRVKTDFLYQAEWEKALADGLLTRMDCAWSRDQDYKIYVQDKIREAGADVWKWLNDEGAYFFICGDAKRMAKDVEAALLDIFKTHGGMDDARAAAKLKELKAQGRYQKDVY